MLASNESAFMAYAALRYRSRPDELVDRDTEIVIESFSRSGSTFATMAFIYAQGRPIKVSYHTHAAGLVQRAVRLGIPTLVVIRQPVDSCIANMVRFNVSSKAALEAWLRFYDGVASCVESVVIGRFDDVTNDFGEVTRRVNHRFGTSFVEFDHTPENVEKVFSLIDDRTRSTFGSVVEFAVPRPSANRDERKAAISREFMALRLRALLERANQLFAFLCQHGRAMTS